MSLSVCVILAIVLVKLDDWVSAYDLFIPLASFPNKKSLVWVFFNSQALSDIESERHHDFSRHPFITVPSLFLYLTLSVSLSYSLCLNLSVSLSLSLCLFLLLSFSDSAFYFMFSLFDWLLLLTTIADMRSPK